MLKKIIKEVLGELNPHYEDYKNEVVKDVIKKLKNSDIDLKIMKIIASHLPRLTHKVKIGSATETMSIELQMAKAILKIILESDK